MTDNTKSIGMIPVGIPIASLEQLLLPEHVDAIKKNPEQVALVQQLTRQIMTNPYFMRQIEQQLAKPAHDVPGVGDEVLMERASFGWGVHPDLPSGKQAAAAVGAAVAAVAGGPGVAVLAAA
jgi:hypothetical protein